MNRNIFWLSILLLLVSNKVFSTRLNPLNQKDREVLQRYVIFDTKTERPDVGQNKYKSPNGIFLIHYDTTGYHAVSKIDNNLNGISDYVDSVAFYFEKAYNFQVNDIGLKSPYPDDGSDGGDEYDIYLWDLGNSDELNAAYYDEGGVYGFTFDYKDYGIGKFKKSYSFIVIDNDFSPKDSAGPRDQPFKRRPAYKETGINALKITAVHELHHAIQFKYGKSYPTNITIMEMSAMGMEFELYPESIDYLQHTNKIFQNFSLYPFGIDNASTGYGFSILNQFFLTKYPKVSIIKSLWENVEKGIEVYGALDSALKEQGSSLGHDFCEFMDWVYYTGTKTQSGKFLWHSGLIPQFKFYDTQKFHNSPLSSSGVLKPFEIRGIRFIVEAESNFTNDTVDILMTSQDIKSASSSTIVDRDYFISLSSQNVANSIKIPEIDDLYLLFDADELICGKIYVSKGSKTISIEHPFPNPINLNNENVLYFPVPDKTTIGSNMKLNIYNSDMLQLFAYNNLKTDIISNQLIIVWEGNDLQSLSSGVYLFSCESKDKSIFGKFSVIRK